MIKSEARILADAFKNARGLTKYYLGKLSGIDPYRTYAANGTILNSIYWLAGHLTWAENYLILKGLHGQPHTESWLENFGLGSKQLSSQGDLTSYEEITQMLDKIYFSAQKHIISLSEDDLNRKNAVDLSFGATDDYSVRALLHHAIRHESCHAGHLGWICKMNGIKTI